MSDTKPGAEYWKDMPGPLEPRIGTFPWLFWPALALVLGFAMWCGWIMHTVSVERGLVEQRVGWLSSAQALQKNLRKGRDENTVRALQELAREVKLEHGNGAGQEALAAAIAEIESNTPNNEALLAALDGFVKATRGDTAGLSQKLGQRWSALYILTFAALLFASTALALLVVSVRRQRRAEFWQKKLALVLSEVEQGRAAADAANHNKSGFIANMSHELRTPLNAIIGYAELLRESLPHDAETSMATDLDRIIGAGTHLHGVVNAILDLSRIEAGRLELKPSSFELSLLVRGTLDIMGQKAQAKGLELGVEIEPSLDGRYLGDIGRIRQVILNLVANALRFTEHGSVWVRVRRVDGGFRVMVEDTGPGISPESMLLLFKPFSQIGDVGKGGSGLGLAISKQLVEAMGGRIGVESKLAQGSCFWFELPLRAVS